MMDVESLAKELILKNMTPEQQMAVLDSVRSSVAQAKEVQKRKIGENVDLVVQALKKIESDIRERFDSVGNAIEKRVASIKDGRDGIDGKDGRDGKDGKSGRDGAKGDKGDNGRDGRDGVDGVDGVSVTAAHIDFDGSLIITLSSGVELNVGEVVAPDLAEHIKVITNGGGTSQSVLDTLASLQTQINNLIPSQTGNSGKFLTTNGTSLSWATGGGGLAYQGTWNASTNNPTLASSTGTNGYYYIVATAGSTNLNGITDWQIGDWLLFNGTVWQKIDQTKLVTSVASKTGDVVLNNTDVSAFANIAATGGTTVLTSSSAPNYVVTGSGGHTFQLPNATTLPNGIIFSFNNNQSSGTVVVKNNSSTTIETLQSGGYVSIVLLSNAIAAGSWDEHNYAPTNVSWSTNTLDYAGSITSATWNGNAVAYNRGGTGQSSAFVAGGIVYGSTTSALAVTAIGTTGQVLTSAGAGAPTWTTPTTGTVTSVSGTSPVSVATGTTTPVISLATGYGDTQNPYASKTANYVLASPNGSAGAPTFRAIVAADIPTLNQNTTGTASNVTGTVAIGNGGTGQTTATAAFDALAPSQTSNSGKYLTTNGTTTSWATVSATGTVTSVAATVPAFLSITGSPVTTSGTLAIGLSGTALPIANGGTAATSASAARTSLGLAIGTDVLAPNGSAASLTSFPTFNQNTTGSAATVTGNATGSTFGFNSGYGSVATAYGCRAWVNFNGTGTPAIRASGNVSSITDNGVGDYTLNFSTAMPDANYSFSGGTNGYASTDSGSQVIVVKTDAIGGTATTYTTSAFRFLVGRYGGTVTDSTYNNVMIFR